MAADDRTGALETAGAVAQVLGVPVTTVTDQRTARPDDRVVVVDLGTRHLSPAEAAERAAGVSLGGSHRSAHKIDSTLRGNWAVELAARRRRSGASILVVAALPALGRVCAGGIVLEHGRPVHEGPAQRDRTARLVSSRPATLLTAAGEPFVMELTPGADLDRWIADPHGIAVCDAGTDDELRAIGAAWAAGSEVLLAGTSAAIAAGAVAAIGPCMVDAPVPPVLETPVVVVCGSLHPAARRQLERLRVVNFEGVVTVIVTEVPDPDDSADATGVLARLASEARHTIRQIAPRTLVILGGDTAAAVLGDQSVVVGGEIAPGTPWGHLTSGQLTITRAGGFGGPDALVDLLSGTLSR